MRQKTDSERIAELEAQVAELQEELAQARLTTRDALAIYEQQKQQIPGLTLRAFADTIGASYEALKKAQQRQGTTHRGRAAKRRRSRPSELS